MKSIIYRLFTSVYCIATLILTIGLLPLFINTGGFFPNFDATTQILPFIAETKRMFASGHPWWSWNTYLGDNFIGSYAYYTVTSPFAWINCLFPYKYLGVGFTFTLYLKFWACLYLSKLYLKEMGFDEKLCAIGCLLYTFSSWAIDNLGYFMFMEPMMVFPWLLYAIERFIKCKKYSAPILSLAVGVTVITNYYFSVGSLIAAGIYFLVRVLCGESANQKSTRALIINCALQVFIGVLLSCVVLLPVVYQLFGSSRGFLSDRLPSIFVLLERFVMLFYPRMSDDGTGILWSNDLLASIAPNISIFGILPAICLFLIHGLRWLKTILGIYLVIYLTPVNGIMTLFIMPFYTRWVYAMILMVIVALLYLLKIDNGLPKKYICGYVLFTGLLFGLQGGGALVWMHTKDIVFGPKYFTILFMGIVLAINLTCLVYCSFSKKITGYDMRRILIAIGICASSQLIGFSLLNTCLSQRSSTGYDILSELVPVDNSSQALFYRTDYSYVPHNIGLMLDTPTVHAFHSVQNSCYISLFDHHLDGENHAVSFCPKIYRESFDALMSVKNLARYTPSATLDNYFTVKQSSYYIPMGFAYSGYSLRSEMDSLICTEHDIAKGMLNSIVINDEDEKTLSPYLVKTKFDVDVSLDSVVAARRSIVCEHTSASSEGLVANAALDDTTVMFFSIPADRGFSATINGITSKIFNANLGMSALIVPSGKSYIEFKYTTPGLRIGALLTFLGLIIILIQFLNVRSSKSHINQLSKML